MIKLNQNEIIENDRCTKNIFKNLIRIENLCFSWTIRTIFALTTCRDKFLAEHFRPFDANYRAINARFFICNDPKGVNFFQRSKNFHLGNCAEFDR